MLVQNDAYLLQLSYYIHRNPLRSGMVKRLTVALFYDQWIREIIAPDFLEEPPLEGFFIGLKSSVSPLIEKLLSVTKEYNISTEQQL